MIKEVDTVQKNVRRLKTPVPFLNMDSPLRYLKGVGPNLSEVFGRKNINTLGDLISWYPRTYRDQKMVHDFSRLNHGTYVTMYGEVMRKKTFSTAFRSRKMTHSRKGKRIYEMSIKTPGGWIACKYFRLPYRGYFDSIEIGQKVKVSGRVTYYKKYPEFHHPDIHPFNDNEQPEDQLIPVYGEIEKVSQNKIRKMISTVFSALQQDVDFLTDPLPEWMREQYRLIDKRQALEQVHQPDKKFTREYFAFRSPAQKRLIFEEFFFLQLYMGLKKIGLEQASAHPMTPKHGLREKCIKQLAFSLTIAQKKVLQEINTDLEKATPMHRLVQGDVGCGKTIVALLACCQVIENHFQCAIMVPTEILAEQHCHNMRTLFDSLGVRVALLTGKTKNREKREILEQLATGYIHCCVGTHALIQETVQFHQLGLVIIDEQHRFGAHQRNLLKKKDIQAHFLVMTATPIPRSLAMTLYGDLDVSVIDEMPKGRQPVVTRKTYHSKR